MKKINIFLLLILSSCNIVPPTISWEDLSEEHDQQLNILGVITSSSDDDSLNTSFVKVHRSLQVDEASDSLVRYIDENGEAYIFGASSNNGSSPSDGVIFLDVVTDPINPLFLGEWDDFYVHDGMARGDTTVSYTHLTLTTIYSV